MKEAEKKKKTDYRENTEESFYACSAQDCTGLIPSLPRNGEELEAYEELYPYLKEPAEDCRED